MFGLNLIELLSIQLRDNSMTNIIFRVDVSHKLLD
jgi:hypothetical protein